MILNLFRRLFNTKDFGITLHDLQKFPNVYFILKTTVDVVVWTVIEYREILWLRCEHWWI